jgi:hypothetical protein
MSRIGTFADDDVYGWASKSPDLGGAIAKFSQAVYTKNRLPMRTRELARAVIAHDNECTVCMNTPVTAALFGDDRAECLVELCL